MKDEWVLCENNGGQEIIIAVSEYMLNQNDTIKIIFVKK